MKKEILHLFEYNKADGLLIWKNPPQPNTKRLKGRIAGTIDVKGYRVVMIRRKVFKVHRIIWFLETGKWPNVVDHINGKKTDNKFENLRDCSVRQNCSNTYRHRGGKLVGAHWHKRSQVWRSNIVKKGKQICLGYFKTEVQAHRAYVRELQSGR